MGRRQIVEPQNILCQIDKEFTVRYQSAWQNLYEDIAIFEWSLEGIDYKRVFKAPLCVPNFADRSIHDLAPGALALDLEDPRYPRAPRLFTSGKPRSWVPDSFRYLPVDWFLAGPALAPPHGLDILKPPFPVVPIVPKTCMPDGSEFPRSFEWIYELAPGIESIPDLIAEKVRQDQPNIARAADIAAACKQGHLAALRVLMLTTLRRHPLPELLLWNLTSPSTSLLCTIEVPELIKLPLVKKRKAWVAATSDTDRKKASERILHALCIRAAYLVAMGDPGDFFDTVAVNACQKWFDPATGQPKEGIVASLQAPKTCFAS